MAEISARRRIWGWYFFDWASQPYNTLLLTFVFAPYFSELLGDGAAAQALWGYTIAAAGAVIALLAPLLGGQFRPQRKFVPDVLECRELIKRIKLKVQFRHVYRNNNQLADWLANVAR